MAKPKAGAKLSVFKGREAKLNRAIFQTLSQKGPTTIYDTYKQIKTIRLLKYTKYASVNKRMRILGEQGYVKRVGIRKTKAGFGAVLYELTMQAYLFLLLSVVSPDDLIVGLDEAATYTFLASIFPSLEVRFR